MHRACLALVMLATMAAVEPASVAVGPNPSAVAFFEAKIRPVLREHCFECHAGAKKRGGLHVDTLAALLKGGNDEGPAVIPGDVRRSALLRGIRWEGDSDLNMPPKRQLPAAVIADFERWVEIGAPWPDAAPPAVATPEPDPARPPLIGRVHPIAVHMPIACLLLAVFAELLVLLRGPAWRPATILLVAAGALGAIGAVLSGTQFEGGQDPRLLERHETLAWLTLSGSLIAAGLLLLMRWIRLRPWILITVLLITAALVSATGHVGGQMSWGKDWLPL